MSAASGAGGRPGGHKNPPAGKTGPRGSRDGFHPGPVFCAGVRFLGPRRTAPRRRRGEICKIFEDGAD